MEPWRGHPSVPHLGGDRHPMLNLNRRLETYLGRVQLLEEENALLAGEIRGLRRGDRGASARRGALEEGLRRARLEADAAWRERVHAELEAGRAAEELHALELQRQEEARARAEARRELEESRKQLEEEQRAHVWLREKVGELEQEIRHLVGTHREEVAHLEAAFTRSRAARGPALPQRGPQALDLLQLGQEYSLRASRAWQEAAEAHRGQFSRLEESLSEARGRLTRVCRERSESQLKLWALEKETTSARHLRTLLETTAAQRAEGHSQEIQHLQERSARLQAEKQELDQQMHLLLLQSRGLQQHQASLGLEVVTYRALLKSGGLGGDVPLLLGGDVPLLLGGDVPLLHRRRHICITDVVPGPWGVKTNHKTQLSAGHRTTSLPSVGGRGPTAIWSRTPATRAEPPKTTWSLQTSETTYPKIVQDGAVESFRPQEVHEEVTYAEPLSPPNEQEPETTAGDTEGDEDWDEESGLGTQPPPSDEIRELQTTPNSTLRSVTMTREACGFSDGDAPPQITAWPQEEFIGRAGERVQEETEEVIEPNSDSRTSRPMSDWEPEESLFDKTGNISKEDAAEMRQEVSCAIDRNNGSEIEDKLYPDGEEMDTWDSVMERKVDLKTGKGTTNDEEKGQRAEPEEDISAREQKHEKTGIGSDFAASVDQHNETSSKTDTQGDDEQRGLFPGSEQDDDEEDSQNVSVSWRTELESDSYAQDNTLADTTPLIRYKSDETDAVAQAPREDESDSSEGEQERKFGETATWSEGKSKTFGTMEDLCEELEGEEYDLGSSPVGGHNAGGTASGGQSDAETEELSKSTTPTDICHGDELETDRLVEQELENLATESYSAHFAQHQVRESEDRKHLQSIDGKPEQEEAGMTRFTEPDARVHRQLAPSSTFTDPPHENLCVCDPPVGITLPRAEVQEDDHNASDVTEKHPGFADPIGGSEEINISEGPKSEVKVVHPAEESSASHEH
ncbi:nestin [Pungitius pungitius]|uniref:nestin n=1 Tax=Pungitius pungitius TaxID=134920 RepID=UPI002E0FD025